MLTSSLQETHIRSVLLKRCTAHWVWFNRVELEMDQEFYILKHRTAFPLFVPLIIFFNY